MKRWIVILVVVAAVAATVCVWFLRRGNGKQATYRTARVERGDLLQTVRATGTVQPIKLVQVGTQVNGPVTKLYVDYNDEVKEGDLVAQIDPITYEARLAQDTANLAQSQANVEQCKAKLAQAEKDLTRSQELVRRDMLSQSEMDAAVATRDSLAAQLKVAEAAVEQSQASLRLSKANLSYTVIRSPVDGVVVARNVNEGQTVVASMSAQVLFTVATDLREVQVEASIPEADIGKIRAGQPVTCSVDAYDESFQGKVAQVRLAAATVQNVVTYPVVIRTANPDKKLFPGMTASITCEVDRRTNVLRVPNAALRFNPMANSAPDSAGAAKTTRPGMEGPRVWTQKAPGAAPTPVRVATGITDGSFTELKDPGSLREGDTILIGRTDAGKQATTQTVNPFAPTPPPGARRR